MTFYVSIIGDGKLTAYQRAIALKDNLASHGIESNVTQGGLCVKSNDLSTIEIFCKKYTLDNEIEKNGTWEMQVDPLWGKF